MVKYKEMSILNAIDESCECESPTPGNMCIKCPLCGYENVSFCDAKLFGGGDGYEAPWWGRGSLLVIPFSGECGHSFEMCFGFHKGNVSAFCRIEYVPSEGENNAD